MRKGVSRGLRLLLPTVVLFWAFGLTALERRRIEISALLPSSAPTAPLIDSGPLMASVNALAAPVMEGRITGSAGSRHAQAFILDAFRHSRLEPVKGSFDQRFSFTHHSIKGLLTPGRHYTTVYPEATNLAGVMRGSTSPDEWIIVSAHYDHLGIRDGVLYPGADDNASGVATLLAAATYFAAHPPRVSMMFVAFDAEEEGLQGSRYFVAHPPIDLAKVVLMANLDMVSRGDTGALVVAGTGRDARLRALVGRGASGRRIIVQFGHDRPMYLAGRIEDWTHASDHGPLADAGVPWLYFGVEDHPDYHRPTDTADRIPQAFFGEAASLIVSTLVAAGQSR
jgi:hypothetical protein